MIKQPTEKQIEKLLLTYDEYSKNTHNWPYIYEISKVNHQLIYFGANHSIDPKNHQYKILKKYLEKFNRLDVKNKITIIESSFQNAKFENLKEAITKGAEAGFVFQYSKENNIEFKCPEPTNKDIYKYLNTKFGIDEMKAFYFVHIGLHWFSVKNQVKETNIIDYVNRFLQRDLKSLNLGSFTYSEKFLLELFEKLTNLKIDIEDRSIIYSLRQPISVTYITNQIARDYGIFRDIFVTKQIINLWNKGYNLFIVYGGSHAVVQEPALRKLLT